MLNSEFRSKYPDSPHNDPLCYDKYNWGVADTNNDKYQPKYNDPNKSNLSDAITQYCNNLDIEIGCYMEDWRSIKLINPVTKKFYKSLKYK